MPITIKASAGAIEQAKNAGEAQNVPEGYHIFRVQKITVSKSKQDNPQLVCKYKLVGLTRQGEKPEGDYWPITDYVTLEGADTEWKRAEFLTAVNGGKTKLEIEPKKPGTVIGNLVICRVVNEEYNGEDRPKCAKVLPYVEPVDGAEFDELGDEGDIPEENDPDLVIEEESEIVETTEEYEPWDADSLKAAGKEKIKEVAASFDVAIVKGMTIADVVSATLEAQQAWMDEQKNGGTSSEGAEVLDDDEPF